MKKLIAGNWKMNGSLVANELLVSELLAGYKAVGHAADCDVAICVPAPYLAQISSLVNRPFLGRNSDPALVESARAAIDLGAQDISSQAGGAFTGEVSGAMLKEFGVRYCIVGHSERRRYHGETDQVVSHKAKAALASGITPIVCVGETLEEREAGQTEAVVKRQLAAVIHDNGHCISEIVVAYEPVWAIGTGKTATPEQAQAVHAVLRAQLTAASSAAKQRVRILYGGSMNAQNAQELLAQPDIDGGLIGGASLKAADFMQIVAVALVNRAPAAI
jgi:triosephosphate isomerase (TIM)